MTRKETARRYYARNRKRIRIKARAYRLNNPDVVKEQCRKWYKNNRAWVKNYGLKKKYGITLADYDKISVRQNGSCGICRKKSRMLCVDHDHETDEVRGLLCFRCNLAIGHLDDDPELIIQALKWVERTS